MRKFLSGFIVSAAMSSAQASEIAAHSNASILTITPVETPANLDITKITAGLEQKVADENAFLEAQAAIFGVSPEVVIGMILNYAQKAWKVISDNKGVSDVTYNYSNALPKGIVSSADLAGFSELQMRSYRFAATNWAYTEYEAILTVVYQYGGNYQGKGKYLETVSIIPSSVYAGWGQTLSVGVKQISTTNVGTYADPVASLAMELSMDQKGFFGTTKKAVLFQVRGDGSPLRYTLVNND